MSVSMFDDEKIRIIRKMPEGNNILLIWIYLLTLAGKCNAGGAIWLAEDVPYTDEMLATVTDMPLNTVRLAIQTFVKMRMVDVEGNTIVLLNWEKHQNIEGLERIREQKRQRVARHRARMKALTDGQKECNVTVTLRNAPEENRKEEDKNREREERVPYRQIADKYRELCPNLPQIRTLSNRRKTHLSARWRQHGRSIELFEEAFRKLAASKFCNGENQRGWIATFDWLIKNDENMVKVLEGKYDNRMEVVSGGTDRKHLEEHPFFNRKRRQSNSA